MTTETLDAPTKPKRTRKASQYAIEQMPEGGWPETEKVKSVKSAKALMLMENADSGYGPGKYRVIRVLAEITVAEETKRTVK